MNKVNYLMNERSSKDKYKTYYSKEVDPENIYKIMHFYITKGLKRIDQKLNHEKLLLNLPRHIKTIDDVMRYIIE